jgi:PhnB protein
VALSYSLDPSRRLVRLVLHEPPTLLDLEAVIDRLAADSQFGPGYGVLADRWRVTAEPDEAIVRAAIEAIARRKDRFANVRWATVTSHLSGYRMGRLLIEPFADQRGVAYRVFMDEAQALEWLVGEAAAEPALQDAGRVSIAPWLSVRGGARAVEFYKSAFGARETYRVEAPDGAVVSRLSVAEAEFWLSDESPEHGNFSPETLRGGTVKMLLSVADPDAMVARAIAAGARQVHPVLEEHGWRVGRVVDPFGHHWEIARPPEGY